MNFLKLFQNFTNGEFEELNRTQWNEDMKKIVSFDDNALSKFPPEMKLELHKTVKRASKKNLTQPTENFIMTEVPGMSSPLFIYQLNDEYFLIYGRLPKKDIYLKCDQIDSVLKAIDYIGININQSIKNTKGI